MAKTEEYADITIIGAGPTGMTTALLAQRLGLSVCIVDSASGPLQVGRADALNARTQETFELIGVLSELEPHGLKCNTSSTFANGNFVSRQSHWWTSLKNVRRPNFLMIGQADIERVLHSKLDTVVRHGARVEHLEEVVFPGGDILVRTQLHDSVVTSKYAVGADGARSFVRRAMGIPFEGTKPNMVWAVLDTFLDTDFPACPEIITFQVNDQARVSWIPRERGMARFYVLLDGEISQPRVEAEIRKFLHPHRVDFMATEWFSTFEVKERVAKTYFSPLGHVVLAGDAAHVHSVNGGQGLNTGIADAFALTWRLGLAVHGYCTPLPTYDTERRPAAEHTISVASQLVRSTTTTAAQYVSLIEQHAGFITGMGVEYPVSHPGIGGEPRGMFVPGRRCPDVYLHDLPSRNARRVYTVADYSRFVVIVPAVTPLPTARGKAWRPFVDFWAVGEHDAGGSRGEKGDIVAADDCVSVTRFSRITEDGGALEIELGEGSNVVFRPDMYVGYVGGNVVGYLDGLFPPT